MTTEAAEVSNEAPESTSTEMSSDTEEISSEGEGSEGVELAEAEPTIEEQLFEMTVEGESFKLSKDEMIEWAQKGKSSQTKWQEAAKLRKEAAAEKAAVQAAINGDIDQLLEMGLRAGVRSHDEIQNWVLMKAKQILEEPELTESERELAEYKKKFAQQEAEKKKFEEIEKNKEYEASRTKWEDTFSTQIISAITKANLDPDPLLIERVAVALLDTVDESGNVTGSAEAAIEYIKSNESNKLDKYIQTLGIDKLRKLVGEDKLKQLRSDDLSRIKNPLAKTVGSIADQKQGSSENKRISASQFFENLGK